MTEQQILKILQTGPRKSFGSNRDVDKILQRLRVAGLIRYVRIKDGGSGWELVRK